MSKNKIQKKLNSNKIIILNSKIKINNKIIMNIWKNKKNNQKNKRRKKSSMNKNNKMIQHYLQLIKYNKMLIR